LSIGRPLCWTKTRSSSCHTEPAFAALGYHGQVMIADPSTDTVIVRLGDSGYENLTNEPQIAARLERWAREL
jgi:CubicO group peptidase (beta-lactamase class C family)